MRGERGEVIGSEERGGVEEVVRREGRKEGLEEVGNRKVCLVCFRGSLKSIRYEGEGISECDSKSGFSSG
jgi:hypothetical protein